MSRFVLPAAKIGFHHLELNHLLGHHLMHCLQQRLQRISHGSLNRKATQSVSDWQHLQGRASLIPGNLKTKQKPLTLSSSTSSQKKIEFFFKIIVIKYQALRAFTLILLASTSESMIESLDSIGFSSHHYS